MKNNGTAFFLLSDGTIKIDGGNVFGQVPRLQWQEMATPDRHNRVRLGLNCLLVRNGKHCVLVDTGVGSKEPETVRDIYGLGNSRLLRELRARDLSPRDVTDVVLTHLHFDHTGGATRLGPGRYSGAHLSQCHLLRPASGLGGGESARRARCLYLPSDDFLPLQQSGQLQFLDGDTEIVSGIRVKVTNAHTEGHQMVLLNQGGERLAFLGDLVPTPHHLQLACIAAADKAPESTLECKRDLLRQAERRDGYYSSHTALRTELAMWNTATVGGASAP